MFSELITRVDSSDPDYRSTHCGICSARLCVDETSHTCRDCLGASAFATGLLSRAQVSRNGWTKEEWADHERRILDHAERVAREEQEAA